MHVIGRTFQGPKIIESAGTQTEMASGTCCPPRTNRRRGPATPPPPQPALAQPPLRPRQQLRHRTFVAYLLHISHSSHLFAPISRIRRSFQQFLCSFGISRVSRACSARCFTAKPLWPRCRGRPLTAPTPAAPLPRDCGTRRFLRNGETIFLCGQKDATHWTYRIVRNATTIIPVVHISRHVCRGLHRHHPSKFWVRSTGGTPTNVQSHNPQIPEKQRISNSPKPALSKMGNSKIA